MDNESLCENDRLECDHFTHYPVGFCRECNRAVAGDMRFVWAGNDARFVLECVECSKEIGEVIGWFPAGEVMAVFPPLPDPELDAAIRGLMG